MNSLNPPVEVGLMSGTLEPDLSIADLLTALQEAAATLAVPLYLYVLDYENESEKKYLQYNITATGSTPGSPDNKIVPYIKYLFPEFYNHNYAIVRGDIGKNYDKFDQFVTTLTDKEIFVDYYVEEEEIDTYSDDESGFDDDVEEGGVLPPPHEEEVYFLPRIDYFSMGASQVVVGRVIVRTSY